MTRVLVAGGTGVLGREVVSRLLEKGYTVRIMSRKERRGRANVEWAQAQLEASAWQSEGRSAPADSFSNAVPRRNLASKLPALAQMWRNPRIIIKTRQSRRPHSEYRSAQ